MTKPLISIVTVVFNNKALLEKTIQSTLSQTYDSIEYIVVDGGSTDGSLNCIQQYATHLTKWVSQKDKGLYDAMNKGIELASGQWICFLNSGDIFVDENSVEQVAKAISKESKPDILYGNILIKQSDDTLKEIVAKEPCNLQRMYFCHQSAFVKTEVLLRFKFDTKHRMSADLKFFKQCYYEGLRFFHLNSPLVVYDKSGISNTQRNNGLKDNLAVVKEMDKGKEKLLFTTRLIFVLVWRMLQGKK